MRWSQSISAPTTQRDWHEISGRLPRWVTRRPKVARCWLLAAELRQHDFEVEFGVAGIPTAFVAIYGHGGPVVGILAEFDALPGINQEAIPERSPLPGKAAGHACGHNLFGAGYVGAAIAIRD